MLVNSNDMLLKASKNGYAVPAYNINNLEWAKYILEACNEDKSPVILAVTENAIDYMGGYHIVYNLVTGLIKDLNIKIPVCLHLDHGRTKEACFKAIDAGFTSVMIDASDKDLEENIEITREVKNYANKKNVSVEAELGSLSGEEDSMKGKITLINPSDCSYFISATNIDSLAPAVGNKHGFYDAEDEIDYKLIGLVSKEAKVPLVLHGGSGLDNNKLATAIFCGISKININTDLQFAWALKVREYLDYNKELYDPRKIIKSGESAIKKVVHEKNKILGCINKMY